MLAPVRTVAPSALISVADAKVHLRVSNTDEDDLIETLIAAATTHLDGWSGVLGRALVTQTWRQDFGCFPAEPKVRLPLYPVISVSGVTYRDTLDATQTLATSVYAGPFSDELGAYLVLKYGQVWPSTYDRQDAVAVTFVCGYGAASAVPAAIRQAALLLIGHWYANREAVAAGAPATVPMAVDALVAPFRRVGF